MIVVDASVLIAQLDSHDAHHARAGHLLLGAADSPLAASTVTLAEVLVGPARRSRLGEAKAALLALDVQEIRLGSGAAPRLAALRADTGLNLPDCCVLLAAQDSEARRVLSFDQPLARAARAIGVS